MLKKIIISTVFGLATCMTALPASAAIDPEMLTKANAGDADAQIWVAVQCQFNNDFQTAAEWYEKAAEQGNVIAQFNLGDIYELGLGVSQNFATAKEWYEKSCDAGLEPGCEAYARLNAEGKRLKIS